MDRARLGLILLCAALQACPDALDEVPAPGSMVPGALTLRLTGEGLVRLASGLPSSRPELAGPVLRLERSWLEMAETTVVYGPLELDVPTGSPRLDPSPDSGALVASARVEALVVDLPVMHRPALGAPERCIVRLTAEGFLLVGELAISTDAARARIPGPARVTEGPGGFALEGLEGCAEPVRDAAEEIVDTLDLALAQASTDYLTQLGLALDEDAGASVRLHGAAAGPAGEGALRYLVEPVGAPEAQVGADGVTIRFGAAVDARPGPVACGPVPWEPPPAEMGPPAEFPATAPGGRTYAVALGIEARLLQQLASSLAASPFPCSNLEGEAGLVLGDLPELGGDVTLPAESTPVRVRIRPTGGIALTLHDEGPAPVQLSFRGLAVDAYIEVEGADLAVLRAVADVDLPVVPVGTEGGGLALLPQAPDVRPISASSPLLGAPEQALWAAVPPLYAAVLAGMLARHPLPSLPIPARASTLVAAEAVGDHLILYLDLP